MYSLNVSLNLSDKPFLSRLWKESFLVFQSSVTKKTVIFYKILKIRVSFFFSKCFLFWPTYNFFKALEMKGFLSNLSISPARLLNFVNTFKHRCWYRITSCFNNFSFTCSKSIIETLDKVWNIDYMLLSCQVRVSRWMYTGQFD